MDEQVVQRLGLEPHPEGGFYREIHRSTLQVTDVERGVQRSAMTAIHFLLRSGTFSRWHRVSSEELWHHAGGGPLELLVIPPDMERIERIALGTITSGQAAMHVVPAHHWQAARPLEGDALASCIVAPGFEFADFSFMNEVEREQLERLHPGFTDLV